MGRELGESRGIRPKKQDVIRFNEGKVRRDRGDKVYELDKTSEAGNQLCLMGRFSKPN